MDPPKKPPIKPTKNPPQLKSDFVLYATNKEAFYRFKCFKPMNTEFAIKLLVQTLKQATNVQIKDKAPFFL